MATELLQVYRCAICGNIVGMFNDIPDEFRDIELYEEINDYAGQLYHLRSV